MYLLLLYVDNILIASKNLGEINKVKKLLKREFEMKEIGSIKKIMRIELLRERQHRKLKLSHKDIVRINIFSMTN